MELNRRSWITWKLGTGFLLLSVAVFVFALSAGLAPCATVLAQSTSCNVGDTEVFSGTIGVGAEPSAGNAFDVMQSSGSTLPPEWRAAGKVKAADETVNNSATLQDDDDLFFTVGANSSYIVSGVLTVDSGTTADFKFGWTVPSGAAIDGVIDDNLGTASSNASFFTETGTGNNTPGSNVSFRFSMQVVTAGTAGTIQFQWAQRTMDASDTILRKGSGFTIMKLG